MIEDDEPLFEEGDEDFDRVIEYIGPRTRQIDREIGRLIEKSIRASTVRVNWDKAACKGKNPDLWFCPGDTQPSAEAADICFSCPIRLKCLESACVAGERHGMWGGIPENIRAGKGEGQDKSILAYDYEELALLTNVYDVTSRRFRYHRDRLKPWTPGQEYNDENFAKWMVNDEED